MGPAAPAVRRTSLKFPTYVTSARNCPQARSELHFRTELDDVTRPGELRGQLLGAGLARAVQYEEPGELLLRLGVRAVGADRLLPLPPVGPRRRRGVQRQPADQLAGCGQLGEQL